MKTPRSAYDRVGGMRYFPRLLDKVRLYAAGELRDDFHCNLGHGADSWCCGFLHVSYDILKARTLEGGTDEEIFQWCQENGRPLNETDLMVWNSYASKLGWGDFASKTLEKLKEESGLAERDDIVTMFDYFDVDEGRKP